MHTFTSVSTIRQNLFLKIVSKILEQVALKFYNSAIILPTGSIHLGKIMSVLCPDLDIAKHIHAIFHFF